MNSLYNMMKYNAPIQMIAVLLCGIGNRYLYAEDSTLYFFMPGITWAIALLLPILKYSFDTKFALVLFPMANMVLWFLGLALSATFGTLMFAASPLFVFPLVGAIGALCAYLLYAKLVLDVVERKDAFICMVLGYASFMLYMFVNYNGSYKVAIEGLFVYWQPFVGLGCVIAHVRRMNSLRQNPTPLTDAS